MLNLVMISEIGRRGEWGGLSEALNTKNNIVYLSSFFAYPLPKTYHGTVVATIV